MAEYALKKSFHIDNGELDGLRDKDCFVLGYELCWIDRLLENPRGFERPVHVENRERIEEACRDAKREFLLTWMEGDSSESWLHLRVYPTLAGIVQEANEPERT